MDNDIILNAQIDDKIDMSDDTCYNHVRFTFNDDLGYSWIAKSKISVMTVFPMVNQSDVKFFKTLIGAKRNFLRRLAR